MVWEQLLQLRPHWLRPGGRLGAVAPVTAAPVTAATVTVAPVTPAPVTFVVGQKISSGE